MAPSNNHDELYRAVRQLVEYLGEEIRDFRASFDEGRVPANHIYHAVQTLETWMQTQQVDCASSTDRSINAERKLPTCGCGGEMREIDDHGRSTTARCDECRECFLILDDGHGDPAVILLRKFDERRGDGLQRRALDDHGMAERLTVALAADGWPSPATVVDFGIASSAHYDALQEAALAGVTPYELDRVLGDGKAISELIQATTTDPALHVAFRTAFDDLYELGQRFHENVPPTDATIDSYDPRAVGERWSQQIDDPDMELER